MLGRGVLSRLHTLTQQEASTLTVYVDVDQNRQANRNGGFVVQAEALLKELRAKNPEDLELAKAAEHALAMVRALEPQGRSALVVVHPATKLTEVHQARVAFPPAAYWRRGAFLRPVVEAMDEHERYAVVLADSQRARLFTVTMGELTEHEGLLSDTESRSRALGADQWRSQKRQDRRHEESVASHAKRAIDALHELSLHAPFDRLIVAGPAKAAAQLVRFLPRRLQGKLVETISLPVTASGDRVLAGILEVQERMERQQEAELVEGVVAELHDGGKAVVALSGVLDMLNQGRVWKLIYSKNFRTKGGECSECGAFTAAHGGECEYCGAEVELLEQVVDRVSQQVLDEGGQVEVVAGAAAGRLTKLGSIAAVLRY